MGFAHRQSLVGTRQEVLLEGPSKRGAGQFQGRTDHNEIVHVVLPEDAADVDLTGALVRVTIERANRHSLVASLDAATARGFGGATVAPRPRARRALPVVA